MSRRRLVVSLAAAAVACALGAGVGVAPAAAKGDPGDAPSKSAKASPTSKSAKASSSSKSAKKKKPKKPKIDLSSHRADNMPPGWTWPPSRAMKRAGDKCLAKLDELGITWKKASAQKKIATPIIVPSMELGGLKLTSVWRNGPFVMDCQLALAIEEYGPKLAAVGVRELQFSRIWGYTPVRTHGKVLPFLSRHALGLAMDIYAVVDDQGNKSVVETDYPAGNQTLLDLEQAINDSGGFRLCLTPKNDPLSHHDHFHLEAAVIYPPDPSTKPKASARRAGAPAAGHAAAAAK